MLNKNKLIMADRRNALKSKKTTGYSTNVAELSVLSPTLEFDVRATFTCSETH